MCKGVLQHTSIRFTSINTIKLWGYKINYIILIYPTIDYSFINSRTNIIYCKIIILLLIQNVLYI